MSTTVNRSAKLAERSPACPSWCTDHLPGDPGALPMHHGSVTVEGITVELDQNDAPPDAHGPGVGVPAVSPPEFLWLHAADARVFARALLAAADAIEDVPTR